MALGLLATIHCGKGSAPRAGAVAGDDPPGEELREEPMEPREAEAWDRAKDGDDDDRMRLADRLSCAGLREHADDPRFRSTAIRAMAFCGDFSELPWLAAVATESGDTEGADALATVVEQAARPRRATDPEDAEELHAGCTALLALSRTLGAPRGRRVVAIRALRMLADRGCVRASDIPVDLDAK
jgi:hypothetical protein